jgi:hypothetical protein
MQSSEFEAQGLGFRAQALKAARLRAQGSKLWVDGLGFRVLRFRVQGVGS